MSCKLGVPTWLGTSETSGIAVSTLFILSCTGGAALVSAAAFFSFLLFAEETISTIIATTNNNIPAEINIPGTVKNQFKSKLFIRSNSLYSNLYL